MLAEATCSSAIRTAKDIVSDVGEAAAKNSGGLLDLAQCTESHSERDCHRVLVNKVNLSLPIPFHYLEKKQEAENSNFPSAGLVSFFTEPQFVACHDGSSKPEPS